jgi:protein ImuB
MPLTQARILVPGLDVREAQAEADAAFLTRLALFAARRWTPRAALSGADGLWLDLSGVTHLFGGERRMGERILAFCARLGFTARIAVADTYGAAHALARYGGGRVLLCPVGGEGRAIESLPLSALRVGDGVLVPARRLGIERIGDIMAMPAAPLVRRFGKALLTRLHQALGWAGEAFDPIVPADPPSLSLRLLEPIATAEAIEQVLADLMTALVRMLEEQGLGARALTLICQRVDGGEQRLSIGTARATRDGAHLKRLFQMRIDRIEPGFGIEAMGLVATRCEPLGPVSILSPLGWEKREPDIVPLIDRLVGRLGARRLYRLSALESDVPERSVRRLAPLEAPADWPKWPRPVRLLLRAEPVENVVALLPDGPPRRFTWRGRTHSVRRADGPERIHGEWWRRTAEADAVRDYFQVEDEEGARFWLYRRGDGLDPRSGNLGWWLQGMFG